MKHSCGVNGDVISTMVCTRSTPPVIHLAYLFTGNLSVISNRLTSVVVLDLISLTTIHF